MKSQHLFNGNRFILEPKFVQKKHDKINSKGNVIPHNNLMLTFPLNKGYDIPRRRYPKRFLGFSKFLESTIVVFEDILIKVHKEVIAGLFLQLDLATIVDQLFESHDIDDLR